MKTYTQSTQKSNPSHGILAAVAHLGQAALPLRRALRESLGRRKAACLQRLADACHLLCLAIVRISRTEAGQEVRL